MRVGIITASDSASLGRREDISGATVAELCEKRGYEVMAQEIVADEEDLLAEKLLSFCEKGYDLILTTGGTGFSPRDVTPEATRQVIQREAPGIPEAMRYFSLQITKRAMLSRAVAGIRGKTLIVNLPGSPKAVRECLEFVMEDLHHGLEILKGDTGECAR